MRQIFLLGFVGLLMLSAVVYSRQANFTAGPTAAENTELKIAQEEKNPWTNLKLNNSADQFQFAIVTDRTGGHRAKVFSKAIYQLNIMQPEFIMSVGDLIEGYTTSKERIDTEWNEFQGFVNKLEMPFFYIPGNHDLTNKDLVEEWAGRFGRRYYHYIYKDVLFLAINSEDPVSTISPEQVKYFEKVLAENPNVRWTLAFLHKPLWSLKTKDDNGWTAIEKAMAGRNYTVFCGHVHRYQKFVRNGMNYYQLATTGGGSRLRGTSFGEFDHITWITMKKDGPVIANILLDGILPENLNVPDTDETGVVRKQLPTIPYQGQILFDGKPSVGATVRFMQKVTMPKERFNVIADGVTDKDGYFKLTTYQTFDGVPEGEYVVTVVNVGEYDRGDSTQENTLPAKYASPTTSGLKVSVKPIVKTSEVIKLSKD